MLRILSRKVLGAAGAAGAFEAASAFSAEPFASPDGAVMQRASAHREEVLVVEERREILDRRAARVGFG